MSSSKKVLFASLSGFFVLLAAAWIFFGATIQQEKIEQPGLSIDAGIALFQDKKFSEALSVLEGIDPGNPQKWRALFYQGSSHIMLKDYQSAVVYLEQALILEPTRTQIMSSLGVAHFKLGNLKMSKAYFASILELEPDNMEAKGLMDIMANPERQQPGASPDESAPDGNDGEESH